MLAKIIYEVYSIGSNNTCFMSYKQWHSRKTTRENTL